MAWSLERQGTDHFVAHPDGRRLGPVSDGEGRVMVAALNALTKVRLLRAVVIFPGVTGVPGQVVDLPTAVATDLVHCRAAETVTAASAPTGVHDLRGVEPLLKHGRITTRRRAT